MVATGSLDEIYQQLSLRRCVHVRITNLSEPMLAQIGAIEGVHGVEQEVDRLALQLDERKLEPEDLLVSLHGLGARIQMFQPEAMDMETAFMKLTEGRTA